MDRVPHRREMMMNWGVLRTVLDIVGNDRNVSEVERRIDLVHEVQRCRLTGDKESHIASNAIDSL